MSCRVDSTLIAGACVVGNRGLGVMGSVIRATTAVGDAGPGFLYNDWQAGDDNKEFRGLILTPPASGTLFASEDGSFALTGVPTDGEYSFTYRLFVDGADLGTAIVSFVVGSGAVEPGTDAEILLSMTLGGKLLIISGGPIRSGITLDGQFVAMG